MSISKGSRVEQYTWPDSYKTTNSLRKQLCLYGKRKTLTDEVIARTCGACPVGCGYGKRWIYLYKAEQAAEKAAEEARRLNRDKYRETRRRAANAYNARKAEGLTLTGTRREKQQQTWIYIALRPYRKRHGTNPQE